MQELADRFDASPFSAELKPHFNFAPSQETLAVVNWQNQKKLIPMKWGFIPYWSKNNPKPYPLINIRCESLIEKPLFKPYFERQRCLIPADGFFEWRQEGKHKIPYRAIVKEGALFAFAGLWEKSIHADGTPQYAFSLITTEANSLLYSIHDRMPVILTPENENVWLNASLRSIHELSPLLRPYPTEHMSLFQVSHEVNSTKHDTPDCIVPVQRMKS